METSINEIIVKETATNKVKGNVKPFVKNVESTGTMSGIFKKVSYALYKNTLILF